MDRHSEVRQLDELSVADRMLKMGRRIRVLGRDKLTAGSLTDRLEAKTRKHDRGRGVSSGTVLANVNSCSRSLYAIARPCVCRP